MPFEFCDCDVVQFARGNARTYSRTHRGQYFCDDVTGLTYFFALFL
jgi:hypothetical protein